MILEITKRALRAVTFFAVAHMIVMFIYAIRTGDWSKYNVFAIVELTLFYPELGRGLQSWVISAVISAIIIFIALVVPTSSYKPSGVDKVAKDLD